MNSRYSGRDIINFFLLYAGAIITVYLLPGIVAYIYFGILLIMFWRSSKNAFWFILVYFMLDPPAGLFPQDFNYGLPFIKGVNLRFVELFIYVAFFKAIRQKNKFQSVFIKEFQLLLILTVILFLYTIFLNSSVISIVIAAKWIFVWSLIYSIPKLINSYDEWTFFFRMAFIIVFIAFLSQLLQLALGYSPSYLLGTNFSPMMDYGQGEFVLSKMNSAAYDITEARPISSSSIILIALVGAMFFQQYKSNIFPKIYLSLVILISYISILLTATRGWVIAFTFVIFLYFVSTQKIESIARMVILLIILIPLFLRVPIINKQLIGSLKRLSTVESVAQGDFSAEGTSSRVDYSLALINLWKESPVLGWGFSEFYKDNGNGHAGLANLLFSVGILGYLVFIYFWYKLFFTPIAANRLISANNPYKGSLFIFSLAFFIFFILNATSGQQFGIYMSFSEGVYSQIIYYCFSSFSITMAIYSEAGIKADMVKWERL